MGDAMNYMTLEYNNAIVQVEFHLETACNASEVIIVGVTYFNMGKGLTNKEYVPMPVQVDISGLLSDEDINQLQDAVWAKLQERKDA